MNLRFQTANIPESSLYAGAYAFVHPQHTVRVLFFPGSGLTA